MRSLQHSAQPNPRTPEDTQAREETRRCIAVLDDNDQIRHFLRAMLERDYIIEDFDNAVDLLEFLEKTKCDLIVSDLSLPYMDGFDFISALKKNTHLTNIPVVAFTALKSDEARRRALAAGFIAYLVKPDSRNQLLSVIAQNLQRAA